MATRSNTSSGEDPLATIVATRRAASPAANRSRSRISVAPYAEADLRIPRSSDRRLPFQEAERRECGVSALNRQV
jgi:hypothetical protein